MNYFNNGNNYDNDDDDDGEEEDDDNDKDLGNDDHAHGNANKGGRQFVASCLSGKRLLQVSTSNLELFQCTS